MKNIFKTFEYEINLSSEEVISRIMSTTSSSNRLSSSKCGFSGDFFKNHFKLQLQSDNSIFIQNSYNPIFIGKVQQIDNLTKITVKMRPNKLGYLLIVGASLLFIISLILFLISDQLSINALVSPSIIFVFMILFCYGISNNKYSDFDFIIHRIFNDNFI
ncbi:MAG: hypothetical protein J1E85_10170 [Ruminococcus sp.]|nr:hypothetical protein [Ruminococcus sp.]